MPDGTVSSHVGNSYGRVINELIQAVEGLASKFIDSDNDDLFQKKLGTAWGFEALEILTPTTTAKEITFKGPTLINKGEFNMDPQLSEILIFQYNPEIQESMTADYESQDRPGDITSLQYKGSSPLEISMKLFWTDFGGHAPGLDLNRRGIKRFATCAEAVKWLGIRSRPFGLEKVENTTSGFAGFWEDVLRWFGSGSAIRSGRPSLLRLFGPRFPQLVKSDGVFYGFITSMNVRRIMTHSIPEVTVNSPSTLANDLGRSGNLQDEEEHKVRPGDPARVEIDLVLKELSVERLDKNTFGISAEENF